MPKSKELKQKEAFERRMNGLKYRYFNSEIYKELLNETTQFPDTQGINLDVVFLTNLCQELKNQCHPSSIMGMIFKEVSDVLVRYPDLMGWVRAIKLLYQHRPTYAWVTHDVTYRDLDWYMNHLFNFSNPINGLYELNYYETVVRSQEFMDCLNKPWNTIEHLFPELAILYDPTGKIERYTGWGTAEHDKVNQYFGSSQPLQLVEKLKGKHVITLMYCLSKHPAFSDLVRNTPNGFVSVEKWLSTADNLNRFDPQIRRIVQRFTNVEYPMSWQNQNPSMSTDAGTVG